MPRIVKSNRRPGVNQTGVIKECFNAFDTNHDGVISREELSQLLQKMGIKMTSQDESDFFEEIDIDKSGEIEFGEFLDWYTTLMDLAEAEARKTLVKLEETTTFSRQELETIYDNYKKVSASVIDDGTIDHEEFTRMMVGGACTWNQFLVDGLFRLIDKDNSGTITFEEFVEILSIYHNRHKRSADEKHKLMFQLYDVDKDGKISKQDLASILNDCLCCNNMHLDSKAVDRLVDATFARCGAKDFMTLEDYMKEVNLRKL